MGFFNINIVWSFGVLIYFVSIANVQSLSDMEVKTELSKLILNCTMTNPVEMSDLLQLQMLKVPANKEAKCLLACAYRLEGSLNDKGIFDKEKAHKRAEFIADGDKKREENGKKIADICARVNDERVSDGEKGCDRAALLFKCLSEVAPKHGFKL